jgi:hypothetical protein
MRCQRARPNSHFGSKQRSIGTSEYQCWTKRPVDCGDDSPAGGKARAGFVIIRECRRSEDSMGIAAKEAPGRAGFALHSAGMAGAAFLPPAQWLSMHP